MGYHNLLNAMFACVIANLYGINDQFIKKGIKEFKPLEHRLEFVKSLNNINYYNDSKSTNIASTIKALESFNENVILILGGTNKGFNFKELIPSLKSVEKIYSYGKSGKDIFNQLKNNINIEYINDFKDCIISAINKTEKNKNNKKNQTRNKRKQNKQDIFHNLFIILHRDFYILFNLHLLV